MSKKYGKIELQIIEDIAEAIRFHKQTNRQYAPRDYARIIRAMLVLPSGEVSTELSGMSFNISVDGELPTVYKGTTSFTLNGMYFETSVVGSLVE